MECIGKEIDNNLRELIELFNRYVAGITSKAYDHPYHIANPVLSRNIFSSSFFQRFGKYNFCGIEPETDLNALRILKNIFKYYLANFFGLFLLVLHLLCFRSSVLRYERRHKNNDEPLIVVDTFVMIDRIHPAKEFSDNYFIGLYETLDDKNIQYVVLCILFGDKWYNFKRRWETYNILAKDSRNFVTEFELLRLIDFYYILRFILFYPYLTLRLLRVKQDARFDSLFKDEIINTLSGVTLQTYMRYLIGKRLSDLSAHIKVISWFENQAIDKLLYRGLRDAGKHHLIYGTQYYGVVDSWANLRPIEAEKCLNVIPDKILVKGGYYLPRKSSLNFEVGVAPRESYLFGENYTQEKFLKQNGCGVLLTYDVKESRKIIEMLKSSRLATRKLLLKLHPNHSLHSDFNIPAEWTIWDKSLKALCNECEIVVSGGSGAALEALCMGCSVIICGNQDFATAHPLPNIDRGVLWDIAYDSSEIDNVAECLIQVRNDSKELIPGKVEEIKRMLFRANTPENIIKTLDL